MNKYAIFFVFLMTACSQYTDKLRTDNFEYLCSDSPPLMVERYNVSDEMKFAFDKKELALPKDMYAGTERYSDGVYVFQIEGKYAGVYKNGKSLLQGCELKK